MVLKSSENQKFRLQKTRSSRLRTSNLTPRRQGVTFLLQTAINTSEAPVELWIII